MPVGGAKLIALAGRRGTLVRPGAATFSLYAEDPTISGETYLSVPPAQMDLTAPEPFLNLPFAVQPTPGFLAITTPNPVIRLSTLAPEVATFSLRFPSPNISVSAPAWPNGFTAYREIVIPAGRASEDLAGFIYLFAETLQSLRLVANGGRVTNASAWDIRFTNSAGTKLNHEMCEFEATTGQTKAWVKIDLASASRTILRIYYGKADLAVTEEDPIGTWLGSYHLVLDCLTGRDRSGNGRDFVPVNVATGDLLGIAGDYAGNSVMTRADASFLNGITEGTVQVISEADTSMIDSRQGWLAVNTPTGAISTSAMTLTYNNPVDGVTGTFVHGKVKTAAGDASAVSATGYHTTAFPQLVHFAFRAGEPCRIYVSGLDVTGATSQTMTGAVVLGTGGMYVGTGARGLPTGGWDGRIDELRISKFKLGAPRIAAEYASYLTPQRFYGVGGENLATDATLAPVLPPLFVAGSVGAVTTVNVPALAYHPDGSALTLDLVNRESGAGTAIISGNQLQYTPSSGGEHVIRCDLSEPGGKECTGYVYITAPTTVGSKAAVEAALAAWWNQIEADQYDAADTAAVRAAISAYFATLIATGTPTAAVANGEIASDGTMSGTDVRATLQAELNNPAISVLVLNSGVYRCNGQLNLPAGKTIIGRGMGSTFIALGIRSTVGEVCVIQTTGDNTVVANLCLHGTRNNQIISGVAAEQQAWFGQSWAENGGMHCLRNVGRTGQLLLNVRASEAGADGFYLGKDDTPAVNVSMWDCISDGSRRNGCSPTGVQNARIANCIFRNTGKDRTGFPLINGENLRGRGQLPKAGMDAEPNDGALLGVNGLWVVFCTLTDNAKRGIVLDNRGRRVNNVNFIRLDSTGNFQTDSDPFEIRVTAEAFDNRPGTGPGKGTDTGFVDNVSIIECRSGRSIGVGSRQSPTQVKVTGLRVIANDTDNIIRLNDFGSAGSDCIVSDNRTRGGTVETSNIDTFAGLTMQNNGSAADPNRGPTGPVGAQ